MLSVISVVSLVAVRTSPGRHMRFRRHQQHIVERQAFLAKLPLPCLIGDVRHPSHHPWPSRAPPSGYRGVVSQGRFEHAIPENVSRPAPPPQARGGRRNEESQPAIRQTCAACFVGAHGVRLLGVLHMASKRCQIGAAALSPPSPAQCISCPASPVAGPCSRRAASSASSGQRSITFRQARRKFRSNSLASLSQAASPARPARRVSSASAPTSSANCSRRAQPSAAWAASHARRACVARSRVCRVETFSTTSAKSAGWRWSSAVSRASSAAQTSRNAKYSSRARSTGSWAGFAGCIVGRLSLAAILVAVCYPNWRQRGDGGTANPSQNPCTTPDAAPQT